MANVVVKLKLKDNLHTYEEAYIKAETIAIAGKGSFRYLDNINDCWVFELILPEPSSRSYQGGEYLDNVL